MVARFAVLPIDRGESISAYVAEVVRLVADSGMQYRLTAMGTEVEGETKAVFDLIYRCHEEMKRFSNRVYTVIHLDDRKGAKDRLAGKVASVESKLGGFGPAR
jgi:uncharacterized protein (TIGR00106 family)